MPTPPSQSRARPRLRLGHVFLGVNFVVVAAVALLFGGFVVQARRSIDARADALRLETARRVQQLVQAELGHARDAVEHLQQALRLGIVDPGDEAALEAYLFARLLAEPALAELTFTRARLLGDDDSGAPLLAPEGRSQLSVFRADPGDQAPLHSRRIRFDSTGLHAELRARGAGQGLHAVPFSPQAGQVPDPTAHLTFRTPASKRFRGEALWTDLHFSELDEHLPEPQRRVVVTALQAVHDGDGHFLGVVRVGLRTARLDEVARLRVEPGTADDPHRVVIADGQGRLISRLGPHDRYVVTEDDELRVQPERQPEGVRLALAELARRDEAGAPGEHLRVPSPQGPLAVTVLPLGTQTWHAAVVVPASHYTRDLETLRDRAVLAIALVLLVVVAGGAVVLRTMRRGLREIADTTARMRRFEFAASPPRAALREVWDAVEGLERAKTVARAMGRYIPVDLVRRLFESNEEPRLGGDLLEVTVMFTDIAGFTGFAERQSPDTLAAALGRYFETMTGPIAESGGTIDKYIGDAVMALWNAPQPLDGHPARACRAALQCLAATEALYASPAWQGLPPLVTRFGLHTGTAMVGHFGAPARLEYTALGDDVNLASRLEGLGKLYGVRIVVSEAVQQAAAAEFAFRKLDRVAVKGRHGGVQVYELLAPAEMRTSGATAGTAGPHVAVYEQALQAYFVREFARAAALLEPQLADPPSQLLHTRCLELQAAPPGPGWDGVYVATSK